MTIHQPPRLATWILKRLGSTIIEDALVGDLFEAYQTQCSPFWYWGQVGAAIGVGACRDVWHHLPVALGAIVGVIVMLYAYIFPHAVAHSLTFVK